MDDEMRRRIERMSEGLGEAAAKVSELGDVVIRTTGDLRNFFSKWATGLQDETVAKAIQERRCIGEPIGCGQALINEDGSRRFGDFPDRRTAVLYEQEWQITGLCPNCQDAVQRTAEQLVDECCGNSPCTCEEAPAF